MIPSQWSTRTGDYGEAKLFARLNKERILNKYFNRKAGKVLYGALRKYYTKDSPYLVIDTARGRKLNETSRQILHGFIVNTFIPFLEENKIKELSEIKPVVICRFQNYLLMEKQLLPQSINRQISGIKAIFNHLFMSGVIERNVMKDIAPLRTMNNKIRGCFSMEELFGVFKDQWSDKKAYLLCSLIYSAGLRNSELQNLTAKDIVIRGDIHFLNITKSKTNAGIRMIPLHPRIFKSLEEWISEKRRSAEDYLFVKKERQRIFKAAQSAHLFMASLLGRKSEELKLENITFYSGRHFYKTMLNSHNLGDIEELFMGHKVNKELSERYNHKDKRGEKELIKEAKKAIEIIDKSLFQ
jgi:site-specific recombinase XerD